jgi:hypothetical protein
MDHINHIEGLKSLSKYHTERIVHLEQSVANLQREVRDFSHRFHDFTTAMAKKEEELVGHNNKLIEEIRSNIGLIELDHELNKRQEREIQELREMYRGLTTHPESRQNVLARFAR